LALIPLRPLLDWIFGGPLPPLLVGVPVTFYPLPYGWGSFSPGIFMVRSRPFFRAFPIHTCTFTRECFFPSFLLLSPKGSVHSSTNLLFSPPPPPLFSHLQFVFFELNPPPTTPFLSRLFFFYPLFSNHPEIQGFFLGVFFLCKFK